MKISLIPLEFHSFLFQFFFLFFFYKKTIEEECPRDYPFLNIRDGYCYSGPYAYCIIYNSIIYTQRLNNIITFETTNMRYVHFASYSNGDMILQGTTYPESNIRNFIGFKKNGRSLFKDKLTNKDNYFYSINANQTFQGKDESTNIVIKLSGNQTNKKEYLMSISKERSYVEIYDFENGKIYQKLLNDFVKMKYISSYQHVAIPLFSDNNDYYYLFGFIGNTSEDKENKFVLQKHIFKSIENFDREETLNLSVNTNLIAIDIIKTGFSCFQTEMHYIMCFFLNKDKKYIIIAYDENLIEQKRVELPHTNTFYNEMFYKCIHLKEEVGIFIYYVENTFKQIYFPTILFKQYQLNPQKEIIDFSDSITINKLDDVQYEPYLLLTDLIKINNNKIYFCSSNYYYKNKLYIIVLNLYQDKKYQIRYYLINLENLYGLKIDMYMQAHKYNNFISIAFDFKDDYTEKCNGENWKFCISLIIFSYPNSNDKELIIDEYLYKNLTLDYISINLENEVRIENNLFGYVFDGIEIKELLNCENLKIKTNLSNDNIYLNYTLKRNEIIKIEFSGINYNAFV